MRNSYEVFEEQLPMVCREYKHLKIRQQNGQKYLWGTIDITSPAGEVIQDFLIEIHCHEGFPKRFPTLYEIGGYIPKEADWHKYSDDSCCNIVAMLLGGQFIPDNNFATLEPKYDVTKEQIREYVMQKLKE